jgi:hypothetical protein
MYVLERQQELWNWRWQLLSKFKSFEKQLGLVLKTFTEVYVKTMRDTCRRGSNFGACNYICQHPIQECAKI